MGEVLGKVLVKQGRSTKGFSKGLRKGFSETKEWIQRMVACFCDHGLL